MDSWYIFTGWVSVMAGILWLGAKVDQRHNCKIVIHVDGKTAEDMADALLEGANVLRTKSNG